MIFLKYNYLFLCFIFILRQALADVSNVADMREQKSNLQYMNDGMKSVGDFIQSENYEHGLNDMVYQYNNITDDPETLVYLLRHALNSNHDELIFELYDLYRKMPSVDIVLLKRAEGTLARLRGDLEGAIVIYQWLAEYVPDDNRIQLDLASMLFQNKQWREAATIFQQQQQYDLPELVLNNVQNYLDQIEKQRTWQFDGGIAPVYERNINNASQAYCNIYDMCTQNQSQSGLGVRYFLHAKKNTPLVGHHSMNTSLGIRGTSYYWAKLSSYDDMQLEVSIGWQWQNRRTLFAIEPVYRLGLSGTANWEDKIQNNHTFKVSVWQHSVGFTTRWNHYFNSAWRVGLLAEMHQLRYRDVAYARGHNGIMKSLQTNVSWQNAHTSFYGGVSFYGLSPDAKMLDRQENHYAYHRYGFYVGMLKQWYWHNMMTNIYFSWGQRQFAGQWTNENFALRKRKDLERSYGMSIWSPKITFLKMTPKLQWSYQRVDGSHLWTRRRSSQLTISLER